VLSLHGWGVILREGSARFGRGAEQTSEPFRRLLLVPCAAGDGTDCLLCLINARIWRPGPPVHLNEQTERHPRSPLVAVQKGVVLGDTNEEDTRLVNESG